MTGMANACELSINVVTSNRPKALTGLGQTSLQWEGGFPILPHGRNTLPAEKREPKPGLLHVRNVVSPYSPRLHSVHGKAKRKRS